MDNQQKLVNCFVESLGIPTEQVTNELAYQSIVEWDSIGHMALVAELEDVFNVMLDTNDIIDMSNVSVAKKILGKHGVEFA